MSEDVIFTFAGTCQFVLAWGFLAVTGAFTILSPKMTRSSHWLLMLSLFIPYIALMLLRGLSWAQENMAVVLGVFAAVSVAGFAVAGLAVKRSLEKVGAFNPGFSSRSLSGTMREFYSKRCGEFDDVELRRMSCSWFLAKHVLDLWHAMTTFVGVPSKGGKTVRKCDITLLWPAWRHVKPAGRVMDKILIPAARKHWDLMFSEYGSFDDAAEALFVHSQSTFDNWNEKGDFPDSMAYVHALDASWKTLGMMMDDTGARCASSSEDATWWKDACDLTGVGSALEALAIGVPAEDVLVGLEDVPERWSFANTLEGSFSI